MDEVTGNEEENPVNIAKRGLERALNKVEDIHTLVQKKKEELSGIVLNQQAGLFKKLGDFLEKQDVSEVKWVAAQFMVKESASGWSTKITV